MKTNLSKMQTVYTIVLHMHVIADNPKKTRCNCNHDLTCNITTWSENQPIVHHDMFPI